MISNKKRSMSDNSVYKIRLIKGDVVIVRSGKHKGQTGKITAVQPRSNTVTVEGINIIKKHQKPNRQHPQGGIIEITKPILVSKVGLYDPTSKKPSKIGYKLDKDGNKTRVMKRTNKQISPPKLSGGKK